GGGGGGGSRGGWFVGVLIGPGWGRHPGPPPGGPGGKFPATREYAIAPTASIGTSTRINNLVAVLLCNTPSARAEAETPVPATDDTAARRVSARSAGGTTATDAP